MPYPTPLMLALSAAVLAIDPSVPPPARQQASALEENAEHWRAVASYAEAFPGALAKKVADKARPAGEVERVGRRIAVEARELRSLLGDGPRSA